MTARGNCSRTALRIAGPLLVLAVSACTGPPAPAPPTQTLVPPPPTALPTCSVISAVPDVTPASVVPGVSPDDLTIGPPDAFVTVIEYCDFQAPICQSMAAVLANVIHEHPEDVRFVFRPVALAGQLDKSELALRAALAAARQDQFWPMYDNLFVRHFEWESLSTQQFSKWLESTATEIGLDEAAFRADLASSEVDEELQARFNAALSVDQLRLPFIAINGQPQPAFAIDAESIQGTVNLLTLVGRQFSTCPPMIVTANRDYFATLHTEKGDIVLRLHPDKAPLAVNSFVFLARQGWFDNITFHRVIPGFVAQTGDPSGTGKGNPGYLFANETSDLEFDRAGLVAMANSGPDTNGSQFFITFGPAPHLDGGFTIFGTVVEGMEVAEQLTPRNPAEQRGLPPGDLLLSVEIDIR